MSGLTVIKDGSSGRTAKVDDASRLKTAAVTKSKAVDSSLRGETFFITSGVVNLTTDNMSYILFIKNNEDSNWVVDILSATYGSTDGSGDYFNVFTIDPDGGTLITNGVDSVGINLNLGSARQLDAEIKVGAEGSTITGGTSTPTTIIPEGTRFRTFPAGPIVIAPGTSVSVGFQPPLSNTSMNVNAQIVIYRERD